MIKNDNKRFKFAYIFNCVKKKNTIGRDEQNISLSRHCQV